MLISELGTWYTFCKYSGVDGRLLGRHAAYIVQLSRLARAVDNGTCDVYMNTKTLNQQLKDLVPYVVSDDNFSVVADASKSVRNQLAADKEYQKLVSACEKYAHTKFMANKSYRDTILVNAISLFRAARKQLRECKGLPDFEGTDNFSKLVESETKVLDTDARLVSFVEGVINRFEVKKETRKPNFIPYSFAEIRKFVDLINTGLLDRDDIRKRIKKGKPKARTRK